MKDIFITKIYIDKVRHLNNIDIELSKTEKKHLILTGRNGSGKTSVLEEMVKCFNIDYGEIYETPTEKDEKRWYDSCMGDFGINITYNINFIGRKTQLSSIFLFIKALRSLDMIQPSTVTKEADIINNINKMQGIAVNTSEYFLQRMVNLYFMQLSAEKKQDFERVKIIEEWFSNFTESLIKIYKCDALRLEFDDINFEYKIIIPDREPFGLNEMSDGYASFFRIIFELINLVEAKSGKYCDYTMPGIVLIDEIETHMHVELQKEVMPVLTTMFPNIQFIVSTHSPFVINSINNVIVFDLENKRRIEDLTAYSWETIVESYFDTGQYSHEITEKFNKYKELYYKEQRERAEEKEFSKLRAELSLVSPAQKELYNAFQQLELRRKAGKND